MDVLKLPYFYKKIYISTKINSNMDVLKPSSAAQLFSTSSINSNMDVLKQFIETDAGKVYEINSNIDVLKRNWLRQHIRPNRGLIVTWMY